jgi:hypothetical protein
MRATFASAGMGDALVSVVDNRVHGAMTIV